MLGTGKHSAAMHDNHKPIHLAAVLKGATLACIQMALGSANVKIGQYSFAIPGNEMFAILY